MGIEFRIFGLYLWDLDNLVVGSFRDIKLDLKFYEKISVYVVKNKL